MKRLPNGVTIERDGDRVVLRDPDGAEITRWRQVVGSPDKAARRIAQERNPDRQRERGRPMSPG